VLWVVVRLYIQQLEHRTAYLVYHGSCKIGLFDFKTASEVTNILGNGIDVVDICLEPIPWARPGRYISLKVE
jgi:hypothetical protein